MQKPFVLISGKNGQLGKELQDVSLAQQNFSFIFLSKEELNIADENDLKKLFTEYTPSFFINCAAYTAVDKAETEQEKAYAINAEATGNIAKLCNQYKTKLVHVSTDYVFDGSATQPYNETDATNPVNYYGYTKFLGEQLALNNNADTIIMRTSWVYSRYGNNFVKTMLRLMNERNEINVVNDQLGSPTYAKDIAAAIMQIINNEWMIAGNEPETASIKLQSYNGIYNFSNDGIISWFDFAVAIKEIKQLNCEVHPIKTSAYPTPAKRPSYSGLDKEKISSTFNIQLKPWKESLKECLQYL